MTRIARETIETLTVGVTSSGTELEQCEWGGRSTDVEKPGSPGVCLFE